MLTIGTDEQNHVIAWNIGKLSSGESELLKKSERGHSNAVSGQDSSTTDKNPDDIRMCYEHSGYEQKILPLGDYLAMLGGLLDSMLANRATRETSALMLECKVPLRMVKLLVLDKQNPAVVQSTYLQSLANVIRHLMVYYNLHMQTYCL